MDEMRAAQNAAKESWLEPVAELTAAATKARSDIVRLRASLDELGRLRQAGGGRDRARIDRIEQRWSSTNCLARSEVRSGRQASGRGLSPRARSAPAADGHIFELTPAR